MTCLYIILLFPRMGIEPTTSYFYGHILYLRHDWPQPYLIIYIFFYFQICIFGSLANALNVAVLTRRDLASAPINRLLKWLAVADVFVMMEYVPFAIYRYLVSKYWFINIYKGQSWRRGTECECKRDWLWVPFSFQEIELFNIFISLLWYRGDLRR